MEDNTTRATNSSLESIPPPPPPLGLHITVQLMTSITIYGYPVIIVVGVLGNSLAFLVFSRTKMRRHSTSVCYMVVALADIGVLLSTTLFHWIRDTFHVNLYTSSPYLCQILSYLTKIFTTASVWILCLVTLFRFIAVFLPLKVKSIVTMRRTLICLALLCAAIVGLFVPFALELELHFDPSIGLLRCRIEYSVQFWSVFVWIDTVVVFLTPILLQILLNALIIWKISQHQDFRSKQMRTTKSVSNRQFSSGESQERMILKMVLATNLFFILCYVPMMITLLCNEGVQFHAKAQQSSANAEMFLIYIFCFRLSITLVYLSHAGNFFVYLFSGSQFRAALCGIFISPASGMKERNTRSMHSASLSYIQRRPDAEIIPASS